MRGAVGVASAFGLGLVRGRGLRAVTTTGGLVDFWPLTDNELAGRGREYDLILIDETAFTKNRQMTSIWERSIRPTTLTRPDARVWAFSTPNGNDAENFFWQVCNEAKWHFKEHYAPSSASPYITAEELARHKEQSHPLVYEQEYEAKFVDWSGVAFFSLDKLLVNGEPVEYPAACSDVFMVIDTAVKGGLEHDGTAVSWWANSQFGQHAPLICLDWDIVQIDAALLEAVLPRWLQRGVDLAKECHAIYGFRGAWIEDAQSGSLLLQQGAMRGWPVEALPSELTAFGKDQRAINASGPVYREQVKLSRHAFLKTASFKDAVRNHLVTQVTGFRPGDKEAARRPDDLLDTFTYAVAITLGNSEGFA